MVMNTSRAACESALALERRRFVSVWQAAVRPTSPPNATRHPHLAAQYIYISSRYPHAVYIENPKAASRSMLAALTAIGGFTRSRVPLAGAVLSRAEERRAKQYMQSYIRRAAHHGEDATSQGREPEQTWSPFVFTFLREPLVSAWSGYTEVTHRGMEPRDHAT